MAIAVNYRPPLRQGNLEYLSSAWDWYYSAFAGSQRCATFRVFTWIVMSSRLNINRGLFRLPMTLNGALMWCSIAFLIALNFGCGSDSSTRRLAQSTPALSGSFTPAASTPSMNHAREDATATLLKDGKVLVAGGQDLSGALASIGLFDPATTSFAPTGSLPTMNAARSHPAATLLLSGKVLIAGGSGPSGSLGSVELYNPSTNTFASALSLSSMNTARVGAVSALLLNGKVLIAG